MFSRISVRALPNFAYRRLASSPPAVRALESVNSQQMRTQYVRFGPPRGGKQYQRFGNRKSGFELWQNPNFRKLAGVSALGSVTFYAYNLEVVPVSGRRRFNIVSQETEAGLAKQMYVQTMQQFQGRILPVSHRITKDVRRVLNRLIPVSGLDDVDWEVFVINDDSIENAFVIPGGKVFVFSGMLPICGDEDGLAAVMSHEIAHSVARHSAERMSKSILVVAALFIVALSIGDPGPLGRILMDLLYLRPGSRKQEAEADYIGLMMMAQACYNPGKAVNLWERMEKAQEFAPPQFLSTHPSNSSRIENIKGWLPEAKDKREMSDCPTSMLEDFREALEGYSSINCVR